MNIQEASSRFHISMEKIRFYEESGLLESQPSSDGTAQYTETELRRIGIIHSLLKAGFDLEMLKKYLRLLDSEYSDKEQQVKILRKQRCILLNDIHDKQQSLDELDYMINEIRAKKTS